MRAKPKHRSRSRPKAVEEVVEDKVTFADEKEVKSDYHKHKDNLKKQIKKLTEAKKHGLSLYDEEEEPPTFHEGKDEKLRPKAKVSGKNAVKKETESL